MAIYFEKRLNIDTALTNRLLLVGNKQPMLRFVAVRAKKNSGFPDAETFYLCFFVGILEFNI